MHSRLKNMENKKFKSREGEYFDGCSFHTHITDKKKTAFPGEETIVIYFKDGLIHNDINEAAVIFEDGLEEIWQNGVFIGIKEKPFNKR